MTGDCSSKVSGVSLPISAASPRVERTNLNETYSQSLSASFRRRSAEPPQCLPFRSLFRLIPWGAFLQYTDQMLA